MKLKDALGRALPTNVEPEEDDVIISPNDITMLERLHWHGLLSTTHTFKLTGKKDHNAHQTRMRMMVRRNARAKIDGEMQDFGIPMKRVYDDRLGFLGGWIPRNLHQVYELTPNGKKLLKALNRLRDYKHDDQFEHRLMRSTITAEIEIGVNKKRDYTFMPRHLVTNLPNGYVHEGRPFYDDGMFAIDYGDVRKNFFLEVDRGTEVKEGMQKRKTVERMIRQWHHFFKRPQSERSPYADLFHTERKDFGYTLFVFVNETQMRNAMAIQNNVGDSPYLLYRFDPRFAQKTFPAPMPSTAHFEGAWERVGHPVMYINKATT
jgi:hypothetical protein